MRGWPVSRVHLETLSNSDLSSLADELGLDLPSGLNRIFVIEEILEASLENQEASSEKTEGAPESTDLVVDETIAPVDSIPALYFDTYINVLLRDPYWVHVFWEIRAIDKEEIEKTEGFAGFLLRVWSLGTPTNNMAQTSFTIDLDLDDCSRYIGLPGSSSWYRVDLCVLENEEEKVIISTKAFKVPDNPYTILNRVQESKVQNIAFLCGIKKLPLLRSKDRVAKVTEQ